MTIINVQLISDKSSTSGAGVHLIVDDSEHYQLSFNIEDYVRVQKLFPYDAAEFAYFAAVIYGCDRAVARDQRKGDRWTREFSINIPVSDIDKWNSVQEHAERMLSFLIGDIWRLNFISSNRKLFGWSFERNRRKLRSWKTIEGDAVSLFSGGLDSLIGTIDWLHDYSDSRLLLASTYDAQAEGARSDQEHILPHLKAAYGRRINRFTARVGLRQGGSETSFRSRSLPFIANAVLAAAFLGKNTPILIPENGAIALNYPLTPARRGSLSTRTVHPKFITMINALLKKLDLEHQITNRYSSMTKGQMMQECKNPSLLERVYFRSVSCGKRGHKENWLDRSAKQCGACIPCLFRRAAIHSVCYAEERFGYPLAPGPSSKRILSDPNNDLPSLLEFIKRNEPAETIWKNLKANGHLNYSEKDEYTSLIKHLRDEAHAWAHHMSFF